MKRYKYTGPVSTLHLNDRAVPLAPGAELELPDHAQVSALVERQMLEAVEVPAGTVQRRESQSRSSTLQPTDGNSSTDESPKRGAK